MIITGKTQIQITRETGLSGAVISQFISDTYDGDNDKIADSLESADSTVFCPELRNTETSLFAVKYAHKNCDVVLLSGDAGAGKTTALRYYTQNNTGVIFITASTCISSPTAILKEISSAIGKKATDNKSQIEKTIVSALSNSNRLIIIDGEWLTAELKKINKAER